MKYKIIIEEVPMGTSCILYKKGLFGFRKIDGYKPLQYAVSLINEFVERCKKLYGDRLEIVDNRFKN